MIFLLLALVFFVPGLLTGAVGGKRGVIAVLWAPAFVLAGRSFGEPREWTLSGLEDEFVAPLVIIGAGITLTGVFFGTLIYRHRTRDLTER